MSTNVEDIQVNLDLNYGICLNGYTRVEVNHLSRLLQTLSSKMGEECVDVLPDYEGELVEEEEDAECGAI